MKRLAFSRLLQVYLRLNAALTPSPSLALCYTCERPTEWTDEGTRYRCAHCGHDPLEHAPEEPAREF